MPTETWHDLGSVEELSRSRLQEIRVGRVRLAVSCENGSFGVISGVCNHVGGPLGEGTLEDGYVVCPWHSWKFHCSTGLGEPGYEDDKVPAYRTRVENGHLFVDLASASPRGKKPHAPHPLARPVVREPGPVRVAGISTTAMDRARPRFSTSDALLEAALEHAQAALGCETRLVRLNELSFRHCEGYYSKSARACTWPCSITQMDPKDQMDQVYEALVHWGDVILVATPIRWGSASSLYYKMVERCNCIQNQETIAKKVLLKNKVAAFVVTGGQDNVQGVVGQMLTFFAELGCLFPQHPFIAHTRGWSAEDMENNVRQVGNSEELRDAARQLAGRAVELARLCLTGAMPELHLVQGGRKAHRLDVEENA